MLLGSTNVVKYADVGLFFYILATSKAISGRVPTCDSVHSWQPYSAAPLGNQVVSTMTWYLTQLRFANTEQTNHCLILILPSTWIGSTQYEYYKWLVWVDHGFEPTISRMWVSHRARSMAAADDIRPCIISNVIVIITSLRPYDQACPYVPAYGNSSS